MTASADSVERTPAIAWQDAPEIAAQQRRTLVTLVIAQIIGGLGVGAGVSMGAIIAYEVTGTESLAGISRTVGALSTALAAAPMVVLAMKFGRRVSLAAGWAAACLGALLQVAAVWHQSLPLLLAGLLLFGAGQAATLQSRFAATDLERVHHRARTLSIVVWATTIGTVIGPNLAAPGARLGAWLALPPIAGAYMITAVATLLAAACLWVGLRPDPLTTAQAHEANDDTAEAPRFFTVIGHLLDQPHRRAVFVALIVNHTIMVTVMTLTPVHLMHGGHGLTIVGFTISLHTLGMFAFSPLVGWLTDRWGGGRTMTAGFGIVAISLGISAACPHQMWGVMVGLFLLGLGWSFVHVSGSAHLTNIVSARWRRPAQGVLDTCTSLGAAFGAGSAGFLLATLGFAGLNLASAVLIAPVAVLAWVALIRPVVNR